MDRTATASTDAVGSAVAGLASTGHRRAFQAVLAAVLTGPPAGPPCGLYVTGARGMGRGTFLRALAAVLPPDRVRLLRLDAGSAPDDLARLLAEAEPSRAAGSPRILLVVSGADALRRDLLVALDELAKALSESPRGLQLLLMGEDTLPDRLKAAHHQDLLRYLARELVLAPLTPTEADDYLAAHAAALAPAERPGRKRRAAILAAAGGNPYLLRRGLDGPEAAVPGSPRDALPWRRIAGITALLATLAGVAAIFTLVTEDADPAKDVATPGWTVPNEPEAPPPVAGLVQPVAPGAPPQPVPPDLAGVPPSRPGTMPSRIGGPENGLIIVAQSGDSLARLYRQVYAGLAPPAFGDVVAINPQKIKPGVRVLFPRPPGGWQKGGARPAPD